MNLSTSLKIAAAKRRLRRMEEDRPLFLNRIAEYSESERKLAIKIFEEALQEAQQELDVLASNKRSPQPE